MLTSDLQNLEGCGLIRVQPYYNLHQNVMRLYVPHMRGTLNHIFHMRRLKSDPITYSATLFQVVIEMILAEL